MNSDSGSSIYKSAEGYAAVMRWYERQLECLSVSVESRWVGTNAGPTHLLVAGSYDAPPLFILHGMNLNAAAMKTAIRCLSPIRRVYAIDIIGMPGKSAGTRPSRTGDGYPRWLREVMTALEIPQADFLGQSFGGWVILKLIAAEPCRVRTAVLLDSGGLVPFTVSGQVRAGFAALRYMLWSTKKNLRRAVQPFYGPTVAPQPQAMRLLGLTYKHVRMDIDLRGLPTPDRDSLSHFKNPIFVSYGLHDIFFRARRASRKAEEIWPEVATTELVENEGHLFSEKGEQNLYNRVAAFLENHAS